MKRGTIEHPKMRALARSIAEILGVELWIGHNVAVATMERLWHYAARYAPDGDLSPHEPVLADVVGWHGPAKPLVAALVLARWLDRVGPRLLVHDWRDHADDAVHMTLARGTRFFADGSMPKLTRFQPAEKRKLLQAYAELEVVSADPVQETLFEVGAPTTPREIRAHGVRTALASASSSSLRSEEEEKSAPPARGVSPPVRLAPTEEDPEPEGLEDAWRAAREAFAAYGGPVGEKLDGRRRALAVAARRARPERRNVLADAVHGYWALRGKATDRWDPLEQLLPETIFAERNLAQYLDAYDRAIARGLSPPFVAQSRSPDALGARLRAGWLSLCDAYYDSLRESGVPPAEAEALRRSWHIRGASASPAELVQLETSIRRATATAGHRVEERGACA